MIGTVAIDALSPFPISLSLSISALLKITIEYNWSDVRPTINIVNDHFSHPPDNYH
jgi:hypothetical protein